LGSSSRVINYQQPGQQQPQQFIQEEEEEEEYLKEHGGQEEETKERLEPIAAPICSSNARNNGARASQ
jgi:hypothetical protein